MPTNEERRDIAVKLRELAGRKWTDKFPHWEDAVLESWHSIRQLLGANHINPDADHEEICNRLADLIELEPERTCRNLSGDDNIFYCSECWNETHGFMVDKFGRTVGFGKVVSGCPNCRRKVMHYANQ